MPLEAISACCATPNALHSAHHWQSPASVCDHTCCCFCLQELALKTLLTGAGVMPKTFSNGWQVPTDTPINYAGPFVLANVSAQYGGKNKISDECPRNYPDGAPRDDCAHISLVEVRGIWMRCCCHMICHVRWTQHNAERFGMSSNAFY
jgi:hypothetical protein